ncbi:hypothetical protein [Vibrio marisflavi]|uniref:Baseplate n=1 Tax=Vibrio marisflavi CECT 7928 TaxID=634439 RepID=A0ABM9AB32_9VIBR|nr:hypothetical protein [Vibrio marisflavi]CAH0543013.1 hypothetical protein VMF7928_04360 [Vibrio marisflavi CECT 7928]
MSDILSDFSILCDEVFSGKTEHTDLTDIDRAVAGFFQHVIDTLTVTDTKRKENQEFARFVDRDKSTKLYTGRFTDPNHFLQKLVGKLGDKVKNERNHVLPTSYITRDQSLVFSDGSDYTDMTQSATLNTESGEAYAYLNKSFLKLNYELTVIAWSEPALIRIMLGIMMWLRHTKNGRQHVFKAKTMIAGAPVESAITITSPRDVTSSVVDLSLDETRLVGMSASFEVAVEVFEAEEVTQSIGTLALDEGGLIV